MSQLARRLAALPPEKRALLEKRLRQQPSKKQSGRVPPLPRDRGSYEASFAQERLWFIEQWESLPLYTEHLLVRLDGTLHANLLQRALTFLVTRHESLRTCFAQADEGLRQILETSSRLHTALPILDLSHLESTASAQEMQRRTRQEGLQTFDLARPPLFRLRLYKLEATVHVLSLTIHHIIFDAWSVGVFFRELFAIYSSLGRGEAPQLPPLPVQYIEFAAWQRRQVMEESLQKQIDYWRRELAAGPEALDLPCDFPRPPVRSGRGRQQHFALSPALTEQLSQLSRRLDATVFMTLLTAFAVLLYRISGQRHLAIGIPITERGRPEWEPLVGLFVNTVVVMAKLDPNETFEGLLQQVRQRTLMAQTHRDVPFEQLVEELQPTRDLSRPPLFQVLFDVQTMPDPPLPDGLSGQLLEVPRETSKFDLYLVLQRTSGGLRGELEYNRDLFAPTTISRWARAYETLLRHLSQAPTTPIAALRLLDSPSQQQILLEWNDAERSRSAAALSLSQLVANEVERSQESVALAASDCILSYDELWRRVQGLSNVLQERGIGPGNRVAVALQRTTKLVISLLAVLESGAAYVPLDPEYPRERLRFVLEDCAADLVLTEAAVEDSLPADASPRLVLEDDLAMGGGNPSNAVDSQPAAKARKAPMGKPGQQLPSSHLAHPESLAYIIYTSGSTGRPKGVAVSHGAAVNFLLSMLREPGLDKGDIFLAVATAAFDISLLEIFGPLASGGRLVLADAASTKDGRQLAELLDTSGATTMQATPAGWQMVLDSGWVPPKGFKALCGGQELSTPLAQRLTANGARLWNLYGPTETTVWSSLQEVKGASLDGSLMEPAATVSLGHPTDNAHLTVVDTRLRPSLVGSPGELTIGGMGLAQGYFSNPALTAKVFVPDPFSSSPGGRRYRTGDRVRTKPDGRMEFLGRKDRQLKIRGFRIEPGEIEATLLRHPGVQSAALVAAPQRTGDSRLVAFITGTGTSEEILEWLRLELPAYLVPSEIRLLEALPLTPNSKVDPSALLRLTSSSPLPTSTSTAEATEEGKSWSETESATGKLFAQVLQIPVEEICLDSDFFALGGHSLLTTRLLATVRDSLGADISLIQFFRKPTVEGLAKEVQARQSEFLQKLPPCLVPIQAGNGGLHSQESPIFWVPPAAGSPLCYLGLIDNLRPEAPAWGLQAPGLRPNETPLSQVPELAAHFIEGIRSVSAQGPFRIAGWSFGAVVAWEMARQLRENGDRVELLALLDGGIDRWHLSRMKHPWKAVKSIVAVLRITLGTRLPRSYEELRTLATWLGLSLPSGAAFAAAGRPRAKLALLRGLLPEVARSLRVLKATFMAGARYRLLPYGGPASLFRTGNFENQRDDYLDRIRQVSQGSLHVTSIPGNHMTLIMDPQHAHTVAERLEISIAGLRPEPGSQPNLNNSTGVKT